MKAKRTFFAEQLRRIMFEKNLTQKEFGKLLGVKRPMISNWITGLRNPSLTSLKKISAALDVPMNYFLEDKISSEKDSLEQQNNKININLIMKLIEENNKRFELEISLLKKEIELLKKK